MKPFISLSDSHVWVRQHLIFEESEEKCDMFNILEFCKHYLKLKFWLRRMLRRIVLRPQLSIVTPRKKFWWSRSLLSVHFFRYSCQISVTRAAYKVFNYIQSQCTDESQSIIFFKWVVGCTEPCYLLVIPWDDAIAQALPVEMMQHDDI